MEVAVNPLSPLSANAVFPMLGMDTMDVLSRVAAPLYIYSFETQRIAWANSAALSFWDATDPEELTSRTLTPYSDSTTNRLAAYRAAFARGEDRVETWTFYPLGKATTALCRCSGVSLSGHPQAMMVEIRSLADNMPVSELRALEALRHTPLMISMFDGDGAVLMRNPAAEACFRAFDLDLGVGADHFRAMFANPADADALLARAQEAGVGSETVALRIATWPTHAMQVMTVSDPATGRRAILLSQQDVSQSLEMRRLLAASEESLDSVLALNVEPALVVAAASRAVLHCNFAARNALGATMGQGADAAELFVDAEDFGLLRASVLSGDARARRVRMRNAQGAAFWASISGVRITYLQSDALVLTVTDVDELYRAAADLEAALDIERQNGEMQRRFLAIAAHELRTPLAIIDSSAQRLERHAATMTPDQVRSRSSRIRNTVKRLMNLLENTLDRARQGPRQDLGDMGYQPQPSDLGAIIALAAAGVSESHRGMTIDVDLVDLPPLNLDRNLIEQVFVNLLTNAAKFAEGPAQVHVTADLSSEDVRILVRDHGIGIPASERERVFSEYVRGTNVGMAHGTGLGLAIVRHIVGLHGGMIEIADTRGPGTTFVITLPLH